MYILKVIDKDSLYKSDGQYFFSSEEGKLRRVASKFTRQEGIYSVSLYKYTPVADVKEFADLNEDSLIYHQISNNYLYLVRKFWTDDKGNTSSSRCKIGTKEECDKFIEQEEQRLKEHKGCSFKFTKEKI